jgi:basic amino acid/polyamine antiporter, APA family
MAETAAVIHGGPKLVRVIGRWSLAALTINSMIGSGIFGLPSQVGGLTGTASPLAVLIAAAATGIVMACYAELVSYFTEAGGPYLYGRETFGPFVGIEIGWLLWLAQLSACAANTNLFVIYLGQFWSDANQPAARFVTLTALVGFLALVNYRGVRGGTLVSNIFTVAKLLPLVVVIAVAMFFMAHHQTLPAPHVHAGADDWLKAILLMFFVFGGFETALVPMSEAKNPRRDAVFALFAALIATTLIYTLIQWIVVRLIANPAMSERPLADVADLSLGRGGAGFVACGALIACYGYLSAKIVGIPRITYALAERGDFPKIFSAIHSRFHTPYVSILVFAFLTWLLAMLGNFSWNVTLSAFARLFYYIAACAGVLMLRRKRPGETRFRLPAGAPLAVIGIAVCLVLMTQVDMSKSLILVATIFAGVLNWLWVRRKEFKQKTAA